MFPLVPLFRHFFPEWRSRRGFWSQQNACVFFFDQMLSTIQVLYFCDASWFVRSDCHCRSYFFLFWHHPLAPKHRQFLLRQKDPTADTSQASAVPSLWRVFFRCWFSTTALLPLLAKQDSQRVLKPFLKGRPTDNTVSRRIAQHLTHNYGCSTN